MNSEEYRRTMGFKMIRERSQTQDLVRKAVETHAERAAKIAKMLRQKQLDEKCTTILDNDIDGVVCCVKRNLFDELVEGFQSLERTRSALKSTHQ